MQEHGINYQLTDLPRIPLLIGIQKGFSEMPRELKYGGAAVRTGTRVRAMHSQEGPGLRECYRETPLPTYQRTWLLGLYDLYNKNTNGFGIHAWPPSWADQSNSDPAYDPTPRFNETAFFNHTSQAFAWYINNKKSAAYKDSYEEIAESSGEKGMVVGFTVYPNPTNDDVVLRSNNSLV
jgi:hypothetical protein